MPSIVKQGIVLLFFCASACNSVAVRHLKQIKEVLFLKKEMHTRIYVLLTAYHFLETQRHPKREYGSSGQQKYCDAYNLN